MAQPLVERCRVHATNARMRFQARGRRRGVFTISTTCSSTTVIGAQLASAARSHRLEDSRASTIRIAEAHRPRAHRRSARDAQAPPPVLGNQYVLLRSRFRPPFRWSTAPSTIFIEDPDRAEASAPRTRRRAFGHRPAHRSNRPRRGRSHRDRGPCSRRKKRSDRAPPLSCGGSSRDRLPQARGGELEPGAAARTG